MVVDQDDAEGAAVSRAGAGAKPRVLLIGPYFSPACYGGAVQVYHQIFSRLRRLDGVIVSQWQGGEVEAAREFDASCERLYGYRMERIPRYDLVFQPGASAARRALDAYRFFRETPRELRAVIARVQPDVLICGATITAGWLMSRMPSDIPTINYLHGEELGRLSTSRFVWRYLFRTQLQAIRDVDLNLSVSRYTAQRAGELAGMDPASIAVLPNFVDLDRYHPPADRTLMRQRLGWEGRKVILSLARLIKRKGFDQGIRAVAQLRATGKLGSDWVHVIAGKGDEEPYLKRLAADLGVAAQTEFTGFVPDEMMAGYYGAADIFLHPNRNIDGDTEGFGIVFLEASACGAPVIGGIAGGTADAIREGVTGFRVDSEDVGALAETILRLTSDEALRLHLSHSGIELVRREYAVDQAVERFEDLVFRTIAAGKRRSRARAEVRE